MNLAPPKMPRVLRAICDRREANRFKETPVRITGFGGPDFGGEFSPSKVGELIDRLPGDNETIFMLLRKAMLRWPDDCSGFAELENAHTMLEQGPEPREPDGSAPYDAPHGNGERL